MNPARTALLWSFAERYIGVVISIATTVVLARLLTPAQVGVYSMCAAITAVAGILRDFGVSEYLIQEKELTRDKIRAAFGIAIIIAWTIGACVFFGRDAISSFYGEPGVGEVLQILTLQFLLLPLSSPAFALMNRELAFRQIFFVNLASTVAHSFTCVYLAILDYGFISLAWGPIASVVVQTAILSFLRRQDTFLLPSFEQAHVVLRYGSMFVSSRTIEVFSRNIHEPVIAKQLDFAAVGLFSRAFGLIDLFHSNVAAAISRVASPAFAEAHRSGHSIAAGFAQATTIFTCVSWPFFTFIALTSREIIGVMFGDQWLAAAPLASILAITALPTGLYALIPQLLASTGHIGRRLRVSAVVAVLHVSGVLIASFFGLHAIAWVWMFSNVLMLILYLRHLEEALGIYRGVLYKPWLSSALVTACSAVAQVAALAVCRFVAIPAIFTLVLVAATGGLTWWLAVSISAHPAHQEVLKLLRQALSGFGRANRAS